MFDAIVGFASDRAKEVTMSACGVSTASDGVPKMSPQLITCKT